MLKRLVIITILWQWMAAAGAATVWTFDGVNDLDFFKSGASAASAVQDRITDDVWLTRDSTTEILTNPAAQGGLFNWVEEMHFQRNLGAPTGTQWAFSGINNPAPGAQFGAAQFANLNFTDFQNAAGGQFQIPFNVLNRPAVVYLENDDIYADIIFTQWNSASPQQQGNSDFAYTRAVAPVNPIPVPAALPLAISGFGLLFAAARRRRT